MFFITRSKETVHVGDVFLLHRSLLINVTNYDIVLNTKLFLFLSLLWVNFCIFLMMF